MSEFIEWLDEMATKDSKIRAVLKKSLAFDPGTYIPAFPYVEKFLSRNAKSWNREMHYLVAGLWAAHWQEGISTIKQPLPKVCAEYMHSNKGSANTEKRFISTIDAEPSQLPNRIRQLMGLLKDYPIDFSRLLYDLLNWNEETKKIQIEWARDFYRASNDESKNAI